jgi:SAM-dependent methyltransferase
MQTNAPLDFSFDNRVVGQYDALRGHPPKVASTIGSALVQALGPQDSLAGSARPCVLELGVGTGRIALPVAAAGARVVGIDLSGDMLATLAGHLHRDPADIDLVRGDITALPFAPHSFDAAMVTHVLHLVADWSRVVQRLAEVVKPQGALLLGRDWVDPASMAGQIRMAFRQAVMQQGFKTAAPAGGPVLHQALLEIGATPVAVGPGELIAAEWTARISPADVLRGIASRDDAESWVLPDEVLLPVCATLEQFVAERWPEKETPQEILRRFVVAVYRTAGHP